MSDADADAVVAFLRNVPPIEHAVPDNQPHPLDAQPLEVPYRLPLDRLPRSQLAQSDANYASAQRGFYLASSLSPCLFCHTPAPEGDSTIPIDIERAFSGQRPMAPVALGVSLEGIESPPMIASFNLTPHQNGIADWNAAAVARAVRFGVGVTELPVCDPMPSTFFGSFLGMNEQDALDLGNYFMSIPPQDSGVIEPCCTACHTGSDADAGAELGAF
jgi:hypothetical protein